jgi:hypothetical protein
MLFNILNKYGRRIFREAPSPEELTLYPPPKSSRHTPGRKLVQFPNMKGRTVEAIELDTSSDHHAVSVRFADKTELWLVLETGFTMRAEHVDMQTGDSRLLKRWPEIRSER